MRLRPARVTKAGTRALSKSNDTAVLRRWSQTICGTSVSRLRKRDESWRIRKPSTLTQARATVQGVRDRLQVEERAPGRSTSAASCSMVTAHGCRSEYRHAHAEQPVRLLAVGGAHALPGACVRERLPGEGGREARRRIVVVDSDKCIGCHYRVGRFTRAARSTLKTARCAARFLRGFTIEQGEPPIASLRAMRDGLRRAGRAARQIWRYQRHRALPSPIWTKPALSSRHRDAQPVG